MKSDLHVHAPAFWSAMNPGVPRPVLPDAPLAAFRVLLEGTADGEFFSVGIYPVADPWPRVALGIATDHWQEQLSMRLTGLENVGGNHSGDSWYLDTEPDPAGLHRVYWRSHDPIDPMPMAWPWHCHGSGHGTAILLLRRGTPRAAEHR